MPIDLEAMYTDDICSVYQHRALLCLAWRKAPIAGSTTALFRPVMDAARRAPHRAVLCALIAPNAGIPDSAAREETQRAIKSLDDHLVGAVNVVGGSGFQAAALRAVLTGFSLFVRAGYPTAFVATEAEAAAFVCQHWPKQDAPAPTTAEVTRALAAVAPR
jgi:hypothetical protein